MLLKLTERKVKEGRKECDKKKDEQQTGVDWLLS